MKQILIGCLIMVRMCTGVNRKFFDPFHPWRRDKRNFDGKLEERQQPTPLTGIDIENMLRDFPNEFGKKQKKPRRVEDDLNPWERYPFFFSYHIESIVLFVIILM